MRWGSGGVISYELERPITHSLSSFSVLSVILSVLFCMLVHANLCLLLPIGAAALTPLQTAGSNHLYAYLQKNSGNTGKERKACSKWILMSVKDMLNIQSVIGLLLAECYHAVIPQVRQKGIKINKTIHSDSCVSVKCQVKKEATGWPQSKTIV